MRSSHTSAETKDQVKGGLLLDVVVTQRPAILELLARKDESLLIGRDALLVLDLLLDIIDGVGRLDVERDGLSREGLDKDWNCKQHTTNWGGAKNER